LTNTSICRKREESVPVVYVLNTTDWWLNEPQLSFEELLEMGIYLPEDEGLGLGLGSSKRPDHPFNLVQRNILNQHSKMYLSKILKAQMNKGVTY
jgi:hypothetical protein